MDMFQKAKGLFLEAVNSHKYAGMNLGLRIFLGIFVMFPCWVLALICMALYYIAAFFVTIADYPADYLLTFLKNEGKEMRHGTEIVIYLVGFPFVFFAKLMIALLTVINFILYFFMTAFFYAATLGGITFSPFLNKEVNRAPKEEPVEEKPEPEAE